ncbi:hypothetical protein H7X46_00195 [Pseudonocardia sp. C8]|uniref:hypothetical protein n=1 Tax=Pseudonocardia sp. C8 TaxID=2762759 RepID=UPI001642FD84|nr:hypothetical protein [Pseudonocardia sp. C8]MBC3189489.1 hypothetical protein [Pseudonocardia sp. C8]
MSPRKTAESMPGQAEQLALEAQRAARVRALSTNPDVIALQVERVRSQVDVLMWTGIVLGLAFCMTNVQKFAARDAVAWSPEWLAAWLLDPMVSLVLIAVIRAEQVTARWQVASTPWARRARWTTLGATYAMNTWVAWSEVDLAMILLHSVPPLAVFVASEAAPGLRDRLTAAVHAAAAADASVLRTGAVTVGEALAATEQFDAAPPEIKNGGGAVAPPESEGPHRLGAAGLGPSSRRWEREELLDASPETRVAQVMDLLRAGLVPAQDLTGEQIGVIFGQSQRTGRRDLKEARRRLDLEDAADVAPGCNGLVLLGPGANRHLEVGA